VSKKFLVAAIFVSSAFVDAPSYVTTVSISLMGALTIVYALAIGALILFSGSESLRELCRFWPLSLLFAFSMLQLLWHPLSAQAAQTLCMQWIFLGLIVLMSTGDNDGLDEEAISRKIRFASIIGAGIEFLVFLAVGFGSEGIGAISFIAARSFALFAVLGVAFFLARWAHGERSSAWFAAAIILLVALSLSRTALVVAAILVPLSRVRSLAWRDLKRILLFSAVAALVLFYLVFSIDALRARFLGSYSVDDFASGEATVDTSGRLAAWAATLSSYVDAPWVGQGPGSANDLIDQVLYRLDIGHPLNEYLRFLHDEGAVGLLLLLLGFGHLLALCWRAYRKSIDAESPHSAFYLATFLALLGSLITMFTDNTASYIFVMGPLGIMIGLAARSLRQEESPSRIDGAKPSHGELGLENGWTP
jgi:O-antigen ligase